LKVFTGLHKMVDCIVLIACVEGVYGSTQDGGQWEAAVQTTGTLRWPKQIQTGDLETKHLSGFSGEQLN